MSKRCSASGLNCRYLNTHIKLKLVELAIKLQLSSFYDLQIEASESPSFFLEPLVSICDRESENMH